MIICIVLQRSQQSALWKVRYNLCGRKVLLVNVLTLKDLPDSIVNVPPL